MFLHSLQDSHRYWNSFINQQLFNYIHLKSTLSSYQVEQRFLHTLSSVSEILKGEDFRDRDQSCDCPPLFLEYQDLPLPVSSALFHLSLPLSSLPSPKQLERKCAAFHPLTFSASSGQLSYTQRFFLSHRACSARWTNTRKQLLTSTSPFVFHCCNIVPSLIRLQQGEALDPQKHGIEGSSWKVHAVLIEIGHVFGVAQCVYIDGRVSMVLF